MTTIPCSTAPPERILLLSVSSAFPWLSLSRRRPRHEFRTLSLPPCERRGESTSPSCPHSPNRLRSPRYQGPPGNLIHQLARNQPRQRSDANGVRQGRKTTIIQQTPSAAANHAPQASVSQPTRPYPAPSQSRHRPHILCGTIWMTPRQVTIDDRRTLPQGCPTAGEDR